MARDIEFPTRMVKYSRRIGGVICKHLKFHGFLKSLRMENLTFLLADSLVGKTKSHA